MNIRDIWTHLVYWYGNCRGGIASAWEWRTNWGFTGGHGSDVGKRAWNNTCNTYIYTQKGHQKDVVKCPCFTSSFLKLLLLESKLHLIVIVIVIVVDVRITVSLQKCRSSSFGFKVSLLLKETEFSCLKDFLQTTPPPSFI